MNHSNSTYYSTGIQQMLINGEQTVDFADMNENKTLYANPYIALNDREYTKHYYTEGQRIASKIGGGLAPSIVHYNQQITPITEDTYAVLSDRLLKRCQLSNGCVGFNGEYTNYGKTIKCVKPLAEIDNEEKDRYFYHSDHIGSSSFITDRNGYASQHLQYLPFGEIFLEQRSTANYYTPYKFSGKEKDEETSYSYFGARYYMSDVSVWLSVDPLWEKFPNVSPYNYCHWNPVMLVDPNGMDDGVILTGDQAAKDETKDQMNKGYSTEGFKVSFNTDGNSLKYEGTPTTPMEKEIAAAIDDPVIDVYVNCTYDNSVIDYFSRGLIELTVGAFEGSEKSSDGKKVFAVQAYNPEHANIVEGLGGFPASESSNHEIMEAYNGAKKSPGINFTSDKFEFKLAYSQAHDAAAWKSGSFRKYAERGTFLRGKNDPIGTFYVNHILYNLHKLNKKSKN